MQSFGVVWKRRWRLAFVVFAVAMTGAVSFMLSLPVIYRAHATILINPGSTSPTAGDPSQSTTLDSVTEEVLSRSRLESIVSRFNLYPKLRAKYSSDAVLGRMRKDINVERKQSEQQWGRHQTFAFTVSYQGWSPNTVANVTNALVSSYVDENNRMHNRLTTESLGSLRTQITQIRKKLDAQEQKITAFKNSHVGELPEQQEANLLTLQQLDAQLRQNTQDQLRLLEGGTMQISQMADSGTATLSQLEQQEANLSARYTDKYPDLVRLRAQIRAMKQAQAANGNRNSRGGSTLSSAQLNGHSANSLLGAYKRDEQRLRNEISQYRQRLQNAPIRQQQIMALMQGYDETNAVYSSLLKRYEETRLAQAGGVSDSQYRVLETAVPPKDAFGPDRLRLFFMVLVICVGLTGVAIFAAEQLDISFHNADELRAFSRVPVLVSIPLIVPPADKVRQGLRKGVLVVLLALLLVLIARIAWLTGHGNETIVWMLTKHI